MMSLIEEHLGPIAIKQWRRFRAKSFLREVDKRSKFGTEELLGLSGTRGVLKRSELESRSAQAENYAGYKLVKPGDLVSNKMQAWNGIFGISSFHGMTSPDYAVYEFHKPCVNRFFEYLFTTLLYATDFKARSNGIGTGFMRLNPSEFLRTNIWIPDIKIQNAIVDFIDSKTSRIDALITKKSRFIELLKEKRQAVITKAVTKGLDDSVEMKDGSFNSIGQIPVHWELSPVGRALRNTKRTVGKRSAEFKLLSLTTRGVIERDVSENFGKFPESFDTYQEVRSGDFVFCLFDMDETPRTVGRSEISGMITGAYSVFECTDQSYSNYLLYLFLHLDSCKGLKSFYTGLRKTIRPPKFTSIRIPFPPKFEAEAIATHLAKQTAQIDAVIKKTERSIELLKEHRSALITAAVTGKIDVREAA